MNSFIELTIEQNMTQPEMISFPADREASFENVYTFIREAMEHFEEMVPAVPDVSTKSDIKPVRSSGKMRFYRELNSELQSTGINFEYLTSN